MEAETSAEFVDTFAIVGGDGVCLATGEDFKSGNIVRQRSLSRGSSVPS